MGVTFKFETVKLTLAGYVVLLLKYNWVVRFVTIKNTIVIDAYEEAHKNKYKFISIAHFSVSIRNKNGFKDLNRPQASTAEATATVVEECRRMLSTSAVG